MKKLDWPTAPLCGDFVLMHTKEKDNQSFQKHVNSLRHIKQRHIQMCDINIPVLTPQIKSNSL